MLKTYSGDGGGGGQVEEGEGQPPWQLALQLSPPQVTQVPLQVPPQELPQVLSHVLPHVMQLPPQLTAQEFTLASWAICCPACLG